MAARQPFVGNPCRCDVCNAKRATDGPNFHDDGGVCKTCFGFSEVSGIPLAQLVAIKEGNAMQPAAELGTNMSEYLAHKVNGVPVDFDAIELYEETRFKSEVRDTHDFRCRQVVPDKFGDGQYVPDAVRLKEVKVLRHGAEDWQCT